MRLGGWRRWRRRLLLLVAGYAAFVFVFQVGIFAAVGLARLFADDPRREGATSPPVKNLRIVDERLWAGAQPSRAEYRGLAARGVRVVVDLRPRPLARRRADARFLDGLGVRYVWLPVRDGQTPDRDTVERFVGVVRSAGGLVYMHCGGGVGRSTSLQAAYEAAVGREPSVFGQLAIGPPTIEQAWFSWRVGPGRAVERNLLVSGLSRAVDAPRQALNWLEARFASIF